MFIQTAETPNPATLKFLPGKPVMAHGTAVFSNKEDLEGIHTSPLARRLFAVQGVEGAFFGSDFISVTKNTAAHWDVLKHLLLHALMDHFTSGDPVLKQTEPKSTTPSNDQEDSAVVKEIKEMLETRVRPAVAADGGDIVFHKFENGIVYLEMQGACSGCPSSTATLKSGIENMLKYYIPEVQEVQAINANTACHDH